MRLARSAVAGALCTAALCSVSCTEAQIRAFMAFSSGSCDFPKLMAVLLLATPYAALFDHPDAKPARIRPDYLVHWGQMDVESRTVSVHLSKEFGESTPLTFGVKPNRSKRTWTVDRRKPMPTAAAFVKERLEELSSETFTVDRVVVTGRGNIPRRSDEVPFRIKAVFKATVETGTLAGRSFTGTFTYAGEASDFGGE